jgi:hypothetical protein
MFHGPGCFRGQFFQKLLTLDLDFKTSRNNELKKGQSFMIANALARRR